MILPGKRGVILFSDMNFVRRLQFLTTKNLLRDFYIKKRAKRNLDKVFFFVKKISKEIRK